jgi:hypothetical protein
LLSNVIPGDLVSWESHGTSGWLEELRGLADLLGAEFEKVRVAIRRCILVVAVVVEVVVAVVVVIVVVVVVEWRWRWRWSWSWLSL